MAGATLLALASDAAPVAAEAIFTPLRFAGRLHPLLVHFPITLVAVAAVLEASRLLRRLGTPSPATFPLVAASAGFAVLAALAGWFNAGWEHAGDTSALLYWHRWLGTLTAALLVLVTFFARRAATGPGFTSWVAAARLGVFAAAGLIAVGGHFGGELVYGEGYVFKGLYSSTRPERTEAPPPPRPADLPSDPRAAFFVQSIEPILLQHCAECHGAKKTKGHLRLDPIGAAFRGPESDWVIVPGDAEQSELLRRVLLDRDDADAMPPEGDGLTADQIKLLKRWIIEGARYPESASLGADQPALVDEPAANAERAIPSELANAIRAIEARGGSARPVSLDSEQYEVNLSHATPAWTNSDLALLAPLAPHLESLNLARSAITDEGLLSLPPCPELTHLRLDHVAVTDRIVDVFLAMPKLASLNLVSSKLGDGGLIRLGESTSLRTLYVWQSAVSEAGIEALRARRPELEVVDGRGPGEPTRSK